jgi:hypothetical protein
MDAGRAALLFSNLFLSRTAIYDPARLSELLQMAVRKANGVQHVEVNTVASAFGFSMFDWNHLLPGATSRLGQIQEATLVQGLRGAFPPAELWPDSKSSFISSANRAFLLRCPQ